MSLRTSPSISSDTTKATSLVNAKALARRLNVTPATVLTWHRRGWIPAMRAGRRPILFDPVEVESALRRRADDQIVGEVSHSDARRQAVSHD